jgi:hypothetical protein
MLTGHKSISENATWPNCPASSDRRARATIPQRRPMHWPTGQRLLSPHRKRRRLTHLRRVWQSRPALLCQRNACSGPVRRTRENPHSVAQQTNRSGQFEQGNPKLALGRIANCAYCASMGRVVIPILSVVVAAAVAILSGMIAHDSFGIATDTIRSDALRSAGRWRARPRHKRP